MAAGTHLPSTQQGGWGVTLGGFCSSRLPVLANTSPNAPARFYVTSTAHHTTSRTQIWATSLAGDTTGDTTSTREALCATTPSITAARWDTERASPGNTGPTRPHSQTPSTRPRLESAWEGKRRRDILPSHVGFDQNLSQTVCSYLSAHAPTSFLTSPRAQMGDRYQATS